MVSKNSNFIVIFFIFCLIVRRSHGCIATVIANPVCSRCPVFTLAANVPPAPVLTSVTSLNADGCTVLTVTCTGPAGAGVTIVWNNNGVQVATSMSEVGANVVSRDISCNSSGQYVLPLTTPGMALQPVTSADCTSP